jgi:hypothetical protein
VTDADPDFVSCFPVQGDWLPPRMACALWIVAGVLADLWREDLDDPTLLLDELPLVARPVADRAWLERFVGCFEDLHRRIGGGVADSVSLPRCTGDEMALHVVIATAEAHVADGLLDEDALWSSLPVSDRDSDFELAREYLLQDHDVLHLFDPALDGIEADDDPDLSSLRTANLHPRDWFKPFGE